MKRALFSIMILAAVSVITGCLTRASAHTKKTVYPDGRVEYTADTSIVGTGDKASQVAGEGMFADGSEEDLGAGFKSGSAKQESTGIEGTLKGMGDLMGGMAKLMAASHGVPTGVASVAPVPTVKPVVVAEPEPTADGEAATEPSKPVTQFVSSTALMAKVTEAKASGKPLVVVAGSPTCGFCKTLDMALSADAEFLARTDMILYRETAPWSQNGALAWTGGGAAPIVRVTTWIDGKMDCDQKLNRPQTVAAIESAISTCVATKK